jgi:hypothetical protein
MTPCTLFFDPHFRFHDGEVGEKIMVTLGALHGSTLIESALSAFLSSAEDT